MSELIYSIVMWTARIHDEIMGMNDGWGYYNSDKKLHFIVMGIIGMIVVLAAYFIFKLLQNHPLVIAFIYVFTVIVVITFAIEIGQKISDSGTMDFADIVFGIAGFLLMFVIFAVIRQIFLAIINLFRKIGKH